jgi:hypothetical protein
MADAASGVICGLIVLFNIFLIFIYIKSKFNSYPYYFNIFFCVTISLNNIIRLITGERKADEEVSAACKAQAIFLTFSDKLILACVCSYSFINYLGMTRTEFYKNKEKVIFIVLAVISILISIISTIIFISQGYSTHSHFCYADTSNSVKKISDSIITGILFGVSLLCLIILMVNIIKLKNTLESESSGRSSNIGYHLCRFSFDIIINIALFIYIFLIINKTLSWGSIAKDIIYIILCLIIEVFFTVNKEFIKETKRILTCQKINTEDNPIATEDNEDSNNYKKMYNM